MSKLPDALYVNGNPENPKQPELGKPLGSSLTANEIRNWVRDYLYFTYINDINGHLKLSPKAPIINKNSNNCRIYFSCMGKSCKWDLVASVLDIRW
jgi:hypothetical protein